MMKMKKRAESGIHSSLLSPALAKLGLLALTLLGPMAGVALAQALPAAEASPISTGFTLPRTLGTLQYAVSASENLSWGYYGNPGGDASTNVSGDVAYLSSAKNDPFSMVLSAGHGWSASTEPSYSFVNLGLSQVVNLGRWGIVLGDGVTYLPETATTGLSGIPGVGDLGVDPLQTGETTGQGVLTNFSTRVVNTGAISVQRQITGKTYLQGTGSYGITRFVGASGFNGLNSTQEAGGGGLTHRIDARNTIGGNYVYSSYTYESNALIGGGQPGLVSQTASAVYTHDFSRKLGFSAAAGPQWTRINSSGSKEQPSLFANISANYAEEFSGASIAYTRSANSGDGVTVGAISDSVVFSARRTFARVWFSAATVAYSDTKSLPNSVVTPSSFRTAILGFQLSRALARSLSVFASYTLEHQSSLDPGASVEVFSGLSQLVGFGITYSPGSVHLGRQ
jgi:hypothetical protein